jgi:hypothetical protein
MNMLTEPGLYDDVAELDYHRDPVGPAPSLSNSIAKLLVHRSARHAAYAHPRLKKPLGEVEKYDAKKAIGTAAHRTLLGKGHAIKVVNAEDFKTAAARSARDQALAAGMTPVLADDMAEVETMVEAARDQLLDTDLRGYFEAPGKSEVTMVWQQPVKGFAPAWCRGRLDRLPDAVRNGGHVIIADLKTTSGSSHWSDWESIAYDMAYDVQSVFYPLGLRTLIPAIRSVEFKFPVLEQKPPYGLTVCQFPGMAIEEAAQDVELALEIWARCLATNTWPSYDGATVTLDKAPWRSMRAEMRRMALQNIIQRWQGIGAEKRPDLLTTAAE